MCFLSPVTLCRILQTLNSQNYAAVPGHTSHYITPPPAFFSSQLLCCSTSAVTLSGAHSHSIQTHVCYVMVLPNQRALEVTKQVKAWQWIKQPGNTHILQAGRVTEPRTRCSANTLFIWHRTEFFYCCGLTPVIVSELQKLWHLDVVLDASETVSHTQRWLIVHCVFAKCKTLICILEQPGRGDISTFIYS